MPRQRKLTNKAALARLPKTFICCWSPVTGSFDQFAAKHRNDRSWKLFELETGHDAMIFTLGRVGEILLSDAN